MTFSVFGYGSLVNRNTLPPHVSAEPVSLKGWRRAWRASSVAHAGGVCALSVVPGDDTIEGLLVTFDDDYRPVIDAREYRYDALAAEALGAGALIFRANAEADRFGDAGNPVHLSYVDVVIQGFLREFGEAGVERFMATTDGWHVPILDDRAAPRYPRAQQLTENERDLSDRMLRMVDATFMSTDEALP
ncbi:gamma-glutamylcyclotransferase [Acuticoccus sediminis]|uniref:Gamma-glutamylcyclotransferase n=1 Tax=Acuticoccus sediminis TaxID=2184697 RepID=A0A8B2NED5_9HYPH|nr:gamma-glutamylcyclotransferase family protein [Acuticoccus sediminis]RAH97030.1 gamma-glutamylcyclotransferase [Acuticoccus sediminis]